MDFSQLLKDIPQSRLLLYLLIIGLLPLLLVGMFLFSNLETVDQLETSLQILQSKVVQKEKKQASNIALANYYRKADHFYIDKNLEKLHLLEPETEALKKISENPNFADNEIVRKRLEFLNGPLNRISFNESAVQSTPQFQEVVELLAHPVEVNQSDIRKILSLVEGVEFTSAKPVTEKPQLILLEFKFDKKSSSDKNEIYVLNMKLLKREYL
ncbi:MAG: hypothetical protein H0U49_03710 [Parachlamydiaceae bacterium]|nr:hypothetical protein [Parachlamydiaceae bacterium]